MSENIEKDYNYILKEIFNFSSTNPSQIYPIVKNTNNICKLKTYMENTKIDNISKLTLLKKLKEFFILNNNLIPFFTTKYNSNTSNFFFPIINLYLSEDTNEEDIKFLESFLYLLNSHVSVLKLSLEFIYQKMSKYYENKGNKKLTESLLIRYLHLLQIFYKDPTNNEDIEQEQPQSQLELKNYIYLNGYGSHLSFSLNYNSSNYNACFPSLENGCSFFFWINLNDQLLQLYSKLYPKVEISLITIIIGGKHIKLLFKDTKYLQIIIDENESNNIGLYSIFQYNKWNNICLVINKSEKNSIKLYINSVNYSNNIFPSNFPLNEKIDAIKCFDNLIGKVSSLLFFSFPLEQKMINYFNIQLKNGFYKNKILFKFLHSIDNEYFNNADNYKYIEKFKNETKLNKEFKIQSDEQNKKNIICFFCPFAYNKNENILDDIFGNYIGYLTENDGVNFFINCTKNIKQTGGMNILLPIAEIMYSSTIKNKNITYNLVDKDILSERTLLEFLNIIKNLLVGHIKNLYDANKSKFFSSLGLFLEKFPSKIYTEKILDVLVDIGKEIFQTEFDYTTSRNDNYINMILLNEKIFSKFSEENQRKLWDKVYQFFISDYSQMKDSLSISKICLLLRFYDEKRYDEYCCAEHAQIFTKVKNNQISLEREDTLKIMDPEMGQKVDKLFDTIQIYINKLIIDNESINLYKLLTLDISPCLQNKIIKVYIKHFESENISKEKIINTLNNLLENDYIEITEYALSISLLDVRLEILKLFKIITSDYYDIFLEKCSTVTNEKKINKNRLENVLNFIGDNLLPDKLLVEIDCLQSKDDKFKDTIQNFNIDDYQNYFDIKKRSYTEKNINIKLNNNFKILSKESMVLTSSKNLVKYFNKIIYDNQINSLYKFFNNEWLMNKIIRDKKIISFVIDFLIMLVCKLSPDYIDNFSNYLFSVFNRNDITNKNSLFENKNIYPWLIETIFFFNNSENIKHFNDKNSIMKIQVQTLDLFTEIFSVKRPILEFKTRIKYILDYSYHMKYIYGENNAKKDEVARITRILLEKVLGCSPGNINLKTQACYEFMIFYKKSEELFNIDYEINKKENRSISCFFSPLPKSELKEYEQELNEKLKEDQNNNNIINDNNINNNIINDEKKSNSINDSNQMEENNTLLMSKTVVKEDKLFPKLINYIPKYILDGLFYSKSNDDNKNNNSQTLNEIWKDFTIYDNIIDYYSSNLWGIENICKKVNIEYNGSWTQVSGPLLEQYGITNSKKNKNILLEEIIKLLNLSSEEEEMLEDNQILFKEKDNKQKNYLNTIKKDLTKNNDELINIMDINLILLSIAIEITKDKEQREYLEKQYQQFLIFCILSSININTSVANYDLIQLILYNILGFGCLFLQKKNEACYKEIVEFFIEPIINEINNDLKKGGFKTIFGIQKKMLYRNTAVFKLFISIYPEEKEKEIDNKKEKENLKSEAVKKRTTRLTTSDKVTPLKRKNIFNLDDDEVDEMTNVNKKNANKNKAFFEFHGDEVNLANKLFEKTLEIYKKNRENPDNRSIIRNYYDINKNENDIDEGILDEKNKVKEKIKELIPFVQTQIKQYSNTSFLTEKKRRNNYKKMKKRLFSWRGFWSNRYLFFKHPEYLKVKVKNHFTKEMVKPLFSPVLDINYYLPNFKKFDKNKLFNNDNYDYNIYLDIDEILDGGSNSNMNIINDNDNKNKEKNDVFMMDYKKRISINSYYNKSNHNGKIHGIKNIYGFNYLECLYKLNYEGIWEIYNDYNDQRLSVDKKDINTVDMNDSFQNQISSEILKNKSSNLSMLEGKLQSETNNHNLNCCIVKPTHHIKGNIITKNNFFIFLYEDNTNKTIEMIQEESENDINFDKDMGCCFGSFFKNHKKDKDNTAFYLEYSNIKYMFIRLYYYQETGIEIYTDTNKSYFLNFKTKDDMHIFLDDILSNASNLTFREIKTENKRTLGYERLSVITPKKKSYHVMNKIDEWQNYMISTLEYLMWLNIYSGRSFNDLTQYPVIPWIISNYQSEQLQHNKNNKRDLTLPMGMMVIENNEKSVTRKETYLETYDSLKNDFKESNPDFNFEAYLQKGDEYFDSYKSKKIKNKKIDDMEIQINQIPYYFGSHYSNATYVSHYLTRIFPYSFVSIEIQGDKFDDPDRMFISMQKTFESACTLKDDVRELIPEFYVMPGMFQNKNNLNLSQGKFDYQSNLININNVILPPWSNNNSTKFVTEMRKILENHDDKINKWIDLIFGSYQRGEKAEEAHNIYMAQTYEKMIKIEEITDPDYRNTVMRMNEIGVTPFKILFNDSKQRIEKNVFFQKSSLYSYSKGPFLYECKILEKITLKTNNYKKIINTNKKHEKKTVNKNEIQTLEINPKIISIKWIDNETLKIFTNSNQWYHILFTILDKEVMSNDSDIHCFENNSSKYASSYQISSVSNNTFIVYGKSKYIIKGGFWDGRMEFNSIPTDPKEQPISKCLFSQYGKPIIVMVMSDDEKYLMCGTTSGLVSIYSVNGPKLDNIDNLFLHSDEITSISINTTLNMFATVSKDGYLLLYIMPSFSLVRAIKLSTKVKKEENNEEIKENKNEKEIEEEEIIKELNKEELKEQKEIKEEKKELNKEAIKENIIEENTPQSEKLINEDNIITTKEDVKDENREEKKDETKEETKDENKEEEKVENKEEEKGENKEESKEEKKEENTEEKNEENKEEIKKDSINENNLENKEISKEQDKEENNNEIKEEKKNENIIKEDENKNNEKEVINQNIIKDNKEEKINKDNIINEENKKEKNKNNNLNIQDDNDEEDEEQIYADNVFLSSSPLPCVTVYISKKRLFRTYTINGEFVGEEQEDDENDSQYIKSPIIFKNLNFQDFLIYGTDKGCVTIRAFPKMNQIGNTINISDSSIETLEISKDKRYCYVWSKDNEINIIKDVSVSSINVSENISRMGFNIGIGK